MPWSGTLFPIVNARADTNPSVVIVYTDDMGIGDIGCYGGKFIATPNVDKLAQDGLSFNRYYSSVPVSSPSRCGLTTELLPIEVGINTFLNDKAGDKRCEQRNYLDDELPSMVHVLQNAGYAIGCIGKWYMGGGRDMHNAPSIKDYGSDECLSTYESPDLDPAITAPKWMRCDDDSIRRWKRTRYFVDKSIDFIKRHRDSPFFLNLWPDDMHTPWVPEFKQKERKSWETKEAFSPALGEMDKQIGRFTKALDNMGLSESTIIIFTSDSGPAPSFKAVHSAYLRGTKSSLYEGGIRIPFIVKYPKEIKPGRVNNSSVLCTVDLYPTLCSMAGIKTEKNYKGDGQNYAGVLPEKSEAKRKTDLMWDFGRNKHFGFSGNPYGRNPHLAIRSDKWKLLVSGDGNDAQLYDMELDKFEKNNIAGKHPGLVAELGKEVYEWCTQDKDKGLQTDL